MLEMKYKMSNLEKLHFSLGVDFARDTTTCIITMNRSQYILDVLKQFGRKNCKLVGTLLDVNFKLVKCTDKEYAL